MTNPLAQPATRRRGQELQDALLDAAWEVLVEDGYAGFTYEAIADRAGTSRPVLYRRWAHRDELLLATLQRNWEPIAVPDTGDLREDAIGFLRNATGQRARRLTLLSQQLADYFREPGNTYQSLRSHLRQAWGDDEPFRLIVGRAVQRGQLADRPRSARVINLPMDLLRHELLMSRAAVPERVIEEIVDDIWLPLLADPSS